MSADDLHTCSPYPPETPCAPGAHLILAATCCCQYCGKPMEEVFDEEDACLDRAAP